MTIGILTYTNDQRYQALHTEGSDEWSLRVTSAQPRDSGVFECQVSTEPKISQAYRLNVVGKYYSFECVLNGWKKCQTFHFFFFEKKKTFKFVVNSSSLSVRQQ